MSLNSSSTFINPKDSLAVPSWVEHLHIKQYADATKMFGDQKWDFPFTNLDLFSVDWFSTENIQKKFFDELWLKDSKNNEAKAIVKLNRIYHESTSYIERVLYRKIPNGLRNKKWSSTSEFLEHINNHLKRNTDGAYSLMFCAIVKVMLVEVGLDENPTVHELDLDMADLMEKFTKIPWMKVNEKSRKHDYKNYTLDTLYNGKLWNRPKSADSMRTKLIYNRPYDKLSKFKDLLALRVELDPSWGEAWYVHTIRKIRDSLYWTNKNINFEIKWDILSPNTIEALKAVGIEVTVKKSKWWASTNYEDAKFVWGRVDISKPGKPKKWVSPEVQFVLPNNKNESGFSEHLVYDLKKILSANVRLFWAMTIGNMQYILEHYKTRFDPRALLNHLLYPQDQWQKPFLQLIKTKSKRTGKDRVYFSTSDIYNEGDKTMSDIYDFPEPKNKEWAGGEDIQKVVHDAVERIMRNIGKYDTPSTL
jgi:hypothetical protein